MNKINRYFPSTVQWGLFFVVILSMGAYYEFYKILFFGPQSIHFWRQTDCLSFTLNYMMEGRGFFNPSIHFIGRAGHGEVITDFPIIFYLVGNIWKITGQQEWIYRLIIFMIFVAGLSFTFYALKDWFQSFFWGLAVSLLLFTSPVIVYYSSNFIMNMPAFSFAMMGLASFYWFVKTERSRWLWLSMGFYLIGGLIKIPALMTFVIILFIYLTEVLGIIRYKESGNIFNRKIIYGIPFVLVIALIALWIMFVEKYNEGNTGIFLVGIIPIWELTLPEIRIIIDAFNDYWYKQHFHRSMHIATILAFLWVLWNYRRITQIERVFITLLPVGVLFFLALWFQAFPNHDYYLTNSYMLILVTWAITIKNLRLQFPRIYNSIIVRSVFIYLLVFNASHARSEINIRYWGWWNNTHFQKYEPLREIKPMLSGIGISRDDIVITKGDTTPNGSLYLLDVKGWSNYGGRMSQTDSTPIASLIEKGARYLVLLDTAQVKREIVRPFVHELLLEHRSIKVFELIDQPLTE